MGFDGEKSILEQQECALNKMRLSEEERQKRVDSQMQIFEAAKLGQGWEELENEIPQAALEPAQSPWFRESTQLAPLVAISRLKRLILIRGCRR